MLRRPSGQREGREQPRPAPHASQGISGEKADGKDIPPISKRRTPLTSSHCRIKNSFYRKCVCLWAHRSFCCLAASVGIYCLPLQLKFSKLLHALTLAFHRTNTTSYLLGKAEFRTRTTYKKTWTEQAFSSIQPQTTATNHSVLVLWTPPKNPKVCVKSRHQQTEVINTTVFKRVLKVNNEDHPSLSKSLCFGSSIKLGQNYTASEQPTTTTQAQRATKGWCFSSRNVPSSRWDL